MCFYLQKEEVWRNQYSATRINNFPKKYLNKSSQRNPGPTPALAVYAGDAPNPNGKGPSWCSEEALPYQRAQGAGQVNPNR